MDMGADQVPDKNGLEKSCERKPNGLEFASIGASRMGGKGGGGWLTTFASTRDFGTGTTAARALRRPLRPYGRYRRKRALQVAEKMRTRSSSFRDSDISCCGQGQGRENKQTPNSWGISVGTVHQYKRKYLRASQENGSNTCRNSGISKVVVRQRCWAAELHLCQSRHVQDVPEGRSTR